MAGLLGDGFDDPQSQMMMGLAQGLLSARGGAGLAAGLGNMQAVRQQGLQNKLLNAQLANYSSEIDARKLAGVKDARQQALIESMFGGGAPAQDAVPATGGQTSAPPGAATGVGGYASGGNGSASSLIQAARQYGIPDQAIQSDMVFNGGKGIAAMLEKHGARDIQVSNGYAYDKNKMGAGYLPQLNISNDGKATQVQIGSDGNPIVSAPRGAPETFGTYQGIQAGIKSANTPIKVFNPQTGREEFTTEGAVVGGQRGAPASQASPGYANDAQMRATAGGDMGADPAALAREIKATKNSMMQANLDAPSKAMLQAHMADLQRQAANLPPTRMATNGAQQPAPQSGNYAAGPSQIEAAQAKANEARLVDTAKADVGRDSSKQQAGKLYGQLTAGVDRAIDLLKQGPTASGAGSLMDSTANFFGGSTKGADVASQLDTLSGWMTANVPRMEGPQSDKDVAQYRIMAGTVGDRTKPISQRLAAAQELKSLQSKYAELNGGYASSGGATGDFGDKPARSATPPPTAMKGMVRGGYKFKGGDPSNQANWEQQ